MQIFNICSVFNNIIENEKAATANYANGKLCEYSERSLRKDNT